jgi:hypothetical protein
VTGDKLKPGNLFRLVTRRLSLVTVFLRVRQPREDCQRARGKVAAGKKLEVPARLFGGGRRFGQGATLKSA